MVAADQLIWLFIGLVVGYGLATVTGYYNGRQLAQLAQMKILAETGRDPMLAKLEAPDAAPLPAPSKAESVKDLNKKIKERYGDEFEVM